MSKAAFASLAAAALALALAFRLAGPDLRPMHHDEANQALKFGDLLETGEYRYDPIDHHGPTLYYLTLPAAWLRGQTTLASLDERTLRLVPAVFGAGLIALLPLLAGGLGRTAVSASAVLAALSPALTYYSRFYIQETLFVFFAMACLIALGRYADRPRAAWATAAGIAAGLAYATKETSVIVLIAAATAFIVARVWTRVNSPAGPGAASAPVFSGRAWHGVLGVACALAVAFVLYSSFFRHPFGLVESFRAFGVYAGRGIEAGPHAQPWDWYFRLLAYSASGGLVWTEGLVLVLALAGLIAACRAGAGFWPRYVVLYSVLSALAYSAVRYKTPWNVLPFYAGFVLLAGHGAAALIDAARTRAARAILLVAILAGACHLGIENWRANFRYPSDPRNPYVYAQTVPDFLRLVQRVTDVASIHPDRSEMLVEVVAGPYEQWPMPWYLRGMKRVGYWQRPGESGRPADAPVIIASSVNAAELDAALADRYMSEFYGLRPGVLLTVFIERGLWDRFLELRR